MNEIKMYTLEQGENDYNGYNYLAIEDGKVRPVRTVAEALKFYDAESARRFKGSSDQLSAYRVQSFTVSKTPARPATDQQSVRDYTASLMAGSENAELSAQMKKVLGAISVMSSMIKETQQMMLDETLGKRVIMNKSETDTDAKT